MNNSLILTASMHAQKGEFSQMIELCDRHVQASPLRVDALIDSANLCQAFGFVTNAQTYYISALELAPNNFAALGGLAKVALDVGDHNLADKLFSKLQSFDSNNEVFRRNALVAMQYDGSKTDSERYKHATEWGKWAIHQAGGWHNRPVVPIIKDRSPRVGFVSADFCQHTVGLFVKDILQALGQQWPVFAYSAGKQEDWVSQQIKRHCTWREVSALDDASLAALIKNDEIDMLIDLSGHTAGSRLTAFAFRPAPVMVSWLGYFATTGMPYIDAVFLDEWHVTPTTQDSFTEKIELLPCGKFYYSPAPWAPKEVSNTPLINNGFITFGCFNNTSKLNPAVFDVWSRIFKTVPHSRLILKWRTLNDQGFCSHVLNQFIRRGVDANRVELRGASFHSVVLKEYADIDIALDPFPFTGGLTSCEALYMGVPVIT
jgi:protein O-GlcNAc transferase